MSRTKLVSLQIGVAVLIIAAWHICANYPVVGEVKQVRFFFSTPGDVAMRIWKFFATGMIWRHLWITLTETMLA